MEFTEELQCLIADAVELANENAHRYLMPEHILYSLLGNRRFLEILEENGGNAKELKKNLYEYMDDNAECRNEEEGATLTYDLQRSFLMAEEIARNSERRAVDISHLFAAILTLEDSYAVYFLLTQGINLTELVGDLSRDSLSTVPNIGKIAEFDGGEEDEEREVRTKDIWKDYVECMNDKCVNENPLIGRGKELERTIQILCRFNKNNVLHIGEPGVGKTAIAFGLARKIVKNQVPAALKGAKIYAIDLGILLAGTQYRGDFEKRFRMIMEGLESEEKPIVYLDEIHNIVGAGAVNSGSFDISNMLKPYLASGQIRFIGATTYEEYKKHFEGNRSLARRFQNIDISEPSEEETIEILKGLKSRYENFHGVKYAKGVLEYAVSMSHKYIRERFLPDKAIDLIDEAGAYRKLHPLDQKTQTVSKKLIDDVLSEICNIPKQTIQKDEIEKLASLEGNLKRQVFGQDEAIKEITNAVQFSRAGLSEEGKPLASFLFVGSTGVGKTEAARALAEELGVKLIRFDMSEYAEKHTIAKLIGSPAGYVGYEEGGLLTEAIRKQPYAVLLLDEIEKAHPDIFNILLQVMDYATLTDNQGRKADFRNVVLIMTSNAGASEMGKKLIGFGNRSVDQEVIGEALKRTFQPEFRNRLSKIVLFHRMDASMAKMITIKKLNQLKEKLLSKKVILEITEDAILFITNKGITEEYGAREIDRVINNEVKPLLVSELLFGKLKTGGTCTIDIKNGELILTK